MPFHPNDVRSKFPALQRHYIFLDAPGGTQMPEQVINAVAGYMMGGISNLFENNIPIVRETHGVVNDARCNAAAFLNAQQSNQVVFGANMSTITAHFSRSIAQEWRSGDDIIVTAADHHANVSFWRQEAERRGVKVNVVRLRADDCTLDYDHLDELFTNRTKLIAYTMASNVTGSLTDAERFNRVARNTGALTFVDFVHYAPHHLPDVQALDCDFAVCSGYKFFGPHVAFLYGKADHLARLNPFKVEPASNESPDRWETGTKSFEALAGLSAAIDYLAQQGMGTSFREKLENSYKRVGAYEQEWSRRFLARAVDVKGLTVHGVTNSEHADLRTPTFAMTFNGKQPQEIVNHMARYDIVVNSGGFYADGVIQALGVADKGGVLRVGAAHYNTFEDQNRFFEALEKA
jgi:cysteine desulfurase family protein (TIGR01976 family)